MKTVTIPQGFDPFVITVNNQEYSYKPGETVVVPDPVADVIENYYSFEPAEPEKKEWVEGFDFDPEKDKGKTLVVGQDGRIGMGNAGGGGDAAGADGVVFMIYNGRGTRGSNTLGAFDYLKENGDGTYSSVIHPTYEVGHGELAHGLSSASVGPNLPGIDGYILAFFPTSGAFDYGRFDGHDDMEAFNINNSTYFGFVVTGSILYIYE